MPREFINLSKQFNSYRFLKKKNIFIATIDCVVYSYDGRLPLILIHLLLNCDAVNINDIFK